MVLWLNKSDEANYTLFKVRQVHKAAISQPYSQPASHIFEEIQNQLSQVTPDQKPRAIPRLKFAAALLTFIITILVIWWSLPPGIPLSWSVENGTPTSFRVYRAQASSLPVRETSDFQLLSELPADPQMSDYKFLDLRSLPGQEYIYRIDVIDDSGRAAVSRLASGLGIWAFPGQITFLSVILLAAYLALSSQRKLSRRSQLTYSSR